MKKIGDLMQDMGFNPEGSVETQKAFIKYLIRVAGQKSRALRELDEVEPDQWQEAKLQPLSEQLSFAFEDQTKAC